MVNTTTISISKRFQNWLKEKGKKGENYEVIIKGLLKPEVLKDLECYEEPDTQEKPYSVDTTLGEKIT